MFHTCPACGKHWECACDPMVVAQHCVEVGGHWEQIACSEQCAMHLHALLVFLGRNFR